MSPRRRRLTGVDLTTVWCAACGCPRHLPCECGWLITDEETGIDVEVPQLGPDGSCPRHPRHETPEETR